MNEQWDVFVSHASEDKERVARPLAVILKGAGLRVWLDENELQLGDSLRRKIDKALASSRYGVVVLSNAFFAKEWPQRELDALSALGSGSDRIILPVWHGVDQKTVARHSPMLADKFAISTEQGLDHVAVAIIGVVRGSTRDVSQTCEQAKSQAATEPQNPASLLGQSLNGYELLELIGSGGSGVVYRARQTTTGRNAAVKVFYPVTEALSFISEVMERGFRALAALNHANIAALFDFNSQVSGSKLSYLGMEYVRGLPLDVWSQQVDSRSDALVRRLGVAIQLTEAVRAAHEVKYTDQLGFEVRGILHGDLKPANVLVSDTGQVKLLDFLLVDIRRLLNPQVGPRTSFRERTREIPKSEIFGTPGFMAPEQEQHGLVTIKTDVFGLGLTFAHLFAPNCSKPTAYIFDDKSIPRALKHLIREMIADTPAARPDDMAAVLRCLKSVRIMIQSRERSWIARIWRFCRKSGV